MNAKLNIYIKYSYYFYILGLVNFPLLFPKPKNGIGFACSGNALQSRINDKQQQYLWWNIIVRKNSLTFPRAL